MPFLSRLSRTPHWLQEQCSSLRHRITGAFLLLTLVTGTVFCLSAYLTYDLALTYVIRWHLEPIMRLLITAEESGVLHKSGERINVSSSALARRCACAGMLTTAFPRTCDRIARESVSSCASSATATP